MSGIKGLVGIPVSSLLPPLDGAPSALLAPSFAVLGPLPATTPLHLALSYLATADLPTYESDGSGQVNNGHGREKERVLVITPGKAEWTKAILEQDEGWLKRHGADYSVLDRLKRVDTRSCPSIDHLSLLLQLVGADEATGTAALASPPGLIVIWDMAQHLLERDDADDTPLDTSDNDPATSWRFKQGASLSDYMQLVSSAKALRDHFSSLRKDLPPTQLAMLEPKLSDLSSLPILTPSSEMRNGLATPTREKRVDLKAGIEWVLGKVVGVSTPEDVAEDGRYTLSLPDDSEVYHLCRRETQAETEGNEAPRAQSYTWEWT